MGDNLLATLEDAPVLYLRGFKHLRSVNLAGNPLCEDPNYEAFVVAYLPSLRFIDWRRITDEMRQGAQLTYQDKLEILHIKEAEAEKAEAERAEAAARQAAFAAACVPQMYGEEWFRAMLDPEMEKLLPIPGLRESLETFSVVTIEKVRMIGEAGLKHEGLRREERRQFDEALAAYTEENRLEGSTMVDAFLERKEQIIAEITEMGLEGAAAASRVEVLEDELDELKGELMELELRLVEQVQEVIATFERQYRELLQGVIEEINACIGDIRETEETYFKEVSEVSVVFLEKYAKGEKEEGIEVPDDLHMLLRDKTVLLNVVTQAHDGHLSAIDSKEDEIIGSLNRELEKLVSGATEAEERRNRTRLSEIVHFGDAQRDDLEELMAE